MVGRTDKGSAAGQADGFRHNIVQLDSSFEERLKANACSVGDPREQTIYDQALDRAKPWRQAAEEFRALLVAGMACCSAG